MTKFEVKKICILFSAEKFQIFFKKIAKNMRPKNEFWGLTLHKQKSWFSHLQGVKWRDLRSKKLHFFSAEKFQKKFKKISQKYATEERILRP